MAEVKFMRPGEHGGGRELGSGLGRRRWLRRAVTLLRGHYLVLKK